MPAYTTNGAVWANGYIGVWHMNQVNAEDSTANRTTCTGYGNATAAGRVGNGQELEAASSDYLNTGKDTLFDLTKDFTISSWAYRKTGGVGSHYPIVDKLLEWNSGFSMSWNGEAGPYFWYYRSGSGWIGNTELDWAATSVDRWYHLAIRNVNGDSYLYRDGAQVDSHTSSSGQTVVQNDNNLLFGKRTNAGRYFNGILDEIRISASSRSADWVWAEWYNMASNGLFNAYSNVVANVVGDPSLPAIANLAAVNITATSADLRGNLTSTGTSDTAVWVYWGGSDCGTNGGATKWAYTNGFGSGLTNGIYTTNTSYSTTLGEGTTYYFNFYAQNASGGVWAASTGWSFRTLGPPAVDNWNGATGIGVGTAAINGRLVNDGGAAASVYLCWGTNDWGTSTSAWPNVVGFGTKTSGSTVTTNLTGLIYGVRYYYRTYGTNSSGGTMAMAASDFVTAYLAGGAAGTGGSVTNYTLNGTNFTAHVFTTVGTSNLNVTGGGAVEVLVVGGGGGGGGGTGGGGGAGGLIYTNLTLIVSNYNVTVGVGGAGGNQTVGRGYNGSNSIFGSILAYGGGGGGANYGTKPPVPGGSGGGGSEGNAGAAGTNGQGYAGGNSGSWVSPYSCGGGGGAGSAGSNGVSSATGGPGGKGVQNSISGVTTWYAGGGGGGFHDTYNPGAAGGLGGGGTGGGSSATGTCGQANTGGGGGGGGHNQGENAGAGGSGIVIVRYAAMATIENTGATPLTATTANLGCTLRATGSYYQVWAYWGQTDGTNNPTAWTSNAYVGAWTDVAETNITFLATGLTGGTTNYYRFLAVNAATNIWATPSTNFVSLAPPTVDNWNGATNVGVGAAAINGRLLTQTATMYLCWGTNDYGISTNAWPNVVGFGTKTSGSTVTTNLTGLLWGIRYWYRTFATNAEGGAMATATNFVTLAPETSYVTGNVVKTYATDGTGFAVSGADLINGVTGVVANNTSPNQDGTVGPEKLTDGIFQTSSRYTIGGQDAQNATITYTLPATVYGYCITGIIVYTDWNDNGRDNPEFSISYATVGNPGAYVALGSSSVDYTSTSGSG
jgi:hypothetical protein